MTNLWNRPAIKSRLCPSPVCVLLATRLVIYSRHGDTLDTFRRETLLLLLCRRWSSVGQHSTGCEKQKCVVTEMINQFCLMMHFAHCRSSHCTYCAYMWSRAEARSQCFSMRPLSVVLLMRHVTTKGSDTGSHMAGVTGGGMFIYKNNDSEEGPSSLEVFCVVNWSFEAEKKNKTANDILIWRCVESSEAAAGDGRSIRVLTQVTTTSTATWQQQAEHSSTSTTAYVEERSIKRKLSALS